MNAYAYGVIVFFALGLAIRFLASHGTMKATTPADLAAMRARRDTARAAAADRAGLEQMKAKYLTEEEMRS